MISITPLTPLNEPCHCCGDISHPDAAQKRIYYIPTNDPYKHICAEVEYPTCRRCRQKYYDKKLYRSIALCASAMLLLFLVVALLLHPTMDATWWSFLGGGLLFSLMLYFILNSAIPAFRDRVIRTRFHLTLTLPPLGWKTETVGEGVADAAYSEEGIKTNLAVLAQYFRIKVEYPANAFSKYENEDKSES